eukprot:636025-Rhodomonas_salina.1
MSGPSITLRMPWTGRGMGTAMVGSPPPLSAVHTPCQHQTFDFAREERWDTCVFLVPHILPQPLRYQIVPIQPLQFPPVVYPAPTQEKARQGRVGHAGSQPYSSIALNCFQGAPSRLLKQNAGSNTGLLRAHLEKPCSFLRMASELGSKAFCSAFRQKPEAAASSSEDITSCSASMMPCSSLKGSERIRFQISFEKISG